MKLRLLSALALFGIFMVALWWPPGYAFLMFTICLCVIREMKIVFSAIDAGHKGMAAWILGFGAFVLTLLVPRIQTVWWLAGCLVTMASLAILFLQVGAKSEKPVLYLNYLVAGISFALAAELRFSHNGIWFAIFPLGVVWFTDSAAYLFGSAFGKTKIAPLISPKKSVEGTLAGVAAAIVFGLLWSQATENNLGLYPLGIAMVGSVIGQLGDLHESKLKRTAHLKDSGDLLPGHGGAWDRFDSFIPTAIVVFVMFLALGRL
jgi:phosphatidate cytidylyltransferase